MGFVKILRKE